MTWMGDLVDRLTAAVESILLQPRSALPFVSFLSLNVQSWQPVAPLSGARALAKDRAEMCYDLLSCPSCPLPSS